MKQITLISGKGGTGKTSLVAALASWMQNTIFTDCDVDAANLYLLLRPEIKQSYPFAGGATARIDAGKCTQCGICLELCRFNAIIETQGNFRVDEIHCEGCKLCMHACPENAIHMIRSQSSAWYESITRFGPMLHARLGIGEDLSGKLVAKLREKARELAKRVNADYILTDGPPGVGCPVIASINGADLVVVVTEPTLAGLADLKRAKQLADHFKIAVKVIVNKADINPEMTCRIRTYCHKTKMEIAGIIPYDEVFLNAMIGQLTVPEYDPENAINRILQDIIQRIR
ncbi:MAG: ATP-binding protein [Bacteroidales bacterium]